MSTELFMRGLLALIMGGCFCWALYRNKNAENAFDPEGRHQRYLPFVSGVILPVFVFGTALVMLIVRPAGVEQSLLYMFFSLFLHISAYYLVLLALMPFLRRHFSAAACAALWLIPNYLYITQQNYIELPAPALVLRLPMWTAGVFLAVWGAGAAAVMLFKILSHLLFRRQALAPARPEEDPAVLAVWDSEVAAARFQKPKFRLVRSPGVASPLSIGLFERTTRVVLPEKEYSPEELALIFRHELVHIGRQDAWSKFFLAFCAAMCWFNPLMWLAMGKSADDLELSCDEAVLRDETDARRRQYADLLLTTAGDGRGFTTCLSPGAKAMRYRLKNVVKPIKKFTGGVLVGVAFFALCMTSGYVTLAFDAGTGAQVLFDGQDPAACTISSAREWDGVRAGKELVCLDEQGFAAFLADLPLDCLTGNYSYVEGTRETILVWDTPKGVLSTVFYEDTIKVTPFYTEKMEASWYSVPGGMDWERFDSFFEPLPALDLAFEDENGERFSNINASLWRLEQGSTVLEDRTGSPEDVSGIFGYEEARQVRFSFSLPVRRYSVTVEPEQGEPYTLGMKELPEPDMLPLNDSPALYQVEAALEGSHGTYKAEFRFAVGDAE